MACYSPISPLQMTLSPIVQMFSRSGWAFVPSAFKHSACDTIFTSAFRSKLFLTFGPVWPHPACTDDVPLRKRAPDTGNLTNGSLKPVTSADFASATAILLDNGFTVKSSCRIIRLKADLCGPADSGAITVRPYSMNSSPIGLSKHLAADKIHFSLSNDPEQTCTSMCWIDTRKGNSVISASFPFDMKGAMFAAFTNAIDAKSDANLKANMLSLDTTEARLTGAFVAGKYREISRQRLSLSRVFTAGFSLSISR